MDKPNIVLYQPRIPQNTGNIARTCAAFKIKLDIIKPIGFSLDDKYLKRAGLDYWKYMDIKLHEDFEEFKSNYQSRRIIGVSKMGGSNVSKFKFKLTDLILFGREDIGLPNHVRIQCHEIVTISMPGIANLDGSGGVRSLNLSVACGIVGFTACDYLKLL